MGRMNRQREMDRDIALLPNPVDAIVALLLHRRVPPSAEVDDVGRSSESEADAGGARGQDQDVEPAVALQMTLKCRDVGLSVSQWWSPR